ncbi:Chitin synthase regulatory factor 3 [Pseudocercospora fuligena]|uniref:Chitin synthase regulatory factor 3 n=1 Tax=Pseudocercospora fuligena TaxID=685502 RepID=A0A8H6VCI7_9PEZI|nr:Chitin synthase regulatory factor 3 [Pseudocercospora fuligena]
MAYDQHSAYEPPRRAYLDRQQPSAPAHAYGGYNDNDYADYASTPYDQYDQGYAQPYQQPNHAYNDGYDQRMNGAHAMNGYQGGYDMPPQQNQQYHQPQERSYDPRYQPRAPRGPPDRGPAPSQRGPPPGREPQHAGQRRPPMQNGYSTQSAPQYDQYSQSNAQYSEPPPPQAQTAAKHRGKTSMDDRKAREKVKMKAQAMSPEVLPFDNAFPVFGGKQKKKNRPDSEQSSDPSQRGSTDQRPMTAPGQRPGASRENSYQNEGYDAHAHPRRPNMDRNQTAPEAPNGRFNGAPPPHVRPGRPGYDQAPPEQLQRHPTGNIATPVDQQYPDQWPMVAGHTPPKAAHSPPQHAENNVNGHVYAQPVQYQQGYEPSQPVSKPLPKQRAPPPIDTSQHYGYNDHNPLSPVAVPQRPSTSHGARPPPGPGLMSPVSQRSQTVETHTSPPPKPWMQTDHSRAGSAASFGDIIDDYGTGAAPAPGQLKRVPTTRAEEIEAEMPDFDSAAPSQTSMLHKRNQTVDKHLAEPSTTSLPQQPPPPMPIQGLPQSSSAPDVRYEQQPYQPTGRPPPGSVRGPPRRGMTGDWYGMPGPGPQNGYGPQSRGPPPNDPRYQQGPMRPPQAPFAQEPPVRRSLDDGRPMPMRGGPPGPPGQQRFYQNGPPPRGGYPPQRPEFDRMQTSQTTWSNPGQGRVGTAPPLRQGVMSPPNGPNGMPLTQQRSAPEQQAPSNNPDALPHHPVPVRPGLMAQGAPQPAKPPPIRNHNGSISSDPAHRRQVSDHFAQPVTRAELERLGAAVDANPNNPKQTLIYVKKLVEAASVLASDGGRADPKTTAKNREKWVMEAFKRLKRIVNSGYPEAQFYLADCYGQGMLGLEVDTKEAFKLYQAAAKAGHPQAAYRTAVCCEMGPEEGGGTSRDFPKAVQWYRRAATLGDGPAMYKIGAVLLKGLLGQQRNITEAVIWLKRGAEHADADNPHALHELAGLYESSNTNPEIRNKVVADDAYARDLFMKAAGLGYKFSQFRLGQAYEYGNLGLPIDNRSSIAWYTKAAAQGEHQAELALSGWYLTGAEGILEHSDTEAYLWARKAASSEPPLAKAMFAMGYFTENGIGCPPSMDEARKWYGRAASYKFPKAVERLEELKRNGGKNRSAPQNGKLTRKDQKHNEENCVVM